MRIISPIGITLLPFALSLSKCRSSFPPLEKGRSFDKLRACPRDGAGRTDVGSYRISPHPRLALQQNRCYARRDCAAGASSDAMKSAPPSPSGSLKKDFRRSEEHTSELQS